MAPRIRKFTHSDINGVLELIKNSVRESLKGHYPDNALGFFLEYHNKEKILRDAEEGLVLLAESDGRLAGTGTLASNLVTRVFISSDFQGGGIGTGIMDRLEQEAAVRSFRKTYLFSTVNAKQFYQRRGYKVVKAGTEKYNNISELKYYLMIKYL